jgi:mannitol-specific phosphotransferase system IIBC component
MDEERITRVITSHLEPISIRLLRDKEGKYRWEIEVHTDNKEEAIGLLKSLDKMLREKFIEGKEEESGYVGRITDISEPNVAKEKEERKKYIIADIRRSGISYARATIIENTIYINPKFSNIKIDDKAIKFLINSLKEIAEKEKFDYQIIEDNGILKKIIIKGKLSEDTLKKIFGKISWSFEKAIEKPIREEEKKNESK